MTTYIDDIDARIYNGFVVHRGREPEYLALNESILKLVNHFSDSNYKPITSICHGKLIPVDVGVLKEKTCT